MTTKAQFDALAAQINADLDGMAAGSSFAADMRSFNGAVSIANYPTPQDAVNDMPDGGILVLPPGVVDIPQTLDFSAKASFSLLGSAMRAGTGPGSMVRGNFPGDLVKIAHPTSSFYIRGVMFVQSHAQGHSALFIDNCCNGQIEFSQVTCAGAYGIYAPHNTFSMGVRNVVFNGTNQTGIGGIFGGHTVLDCCDITGWNEGARAFGSTVSFRTCRIEVNKTGLVLGLDELGEERTLGGSDISGVECEANDIAIDFYNFVAGSVHAVSLGTIGAPSGISQIGFNMRTVGATVFHGCFTTGAYSNSGFNILPNPAHNFTMMNCQSYNGGSGLAWNVPPGLPTVSLVGCNN